MARLSAFILATSLLATPAMAADFLPIQADPVLLPVESSADWTGFSIGVSAGAAFGTGSPGVLQIDQDLDGNFAEALVPPLSVAFGNNFTGAQDSSFTGGISLGYDYQAGDFVIGGIIDVSRVDYADRQSGFSSTPAFYTELRELDYLATARVRAGFLVNDGLLAYVHGGVAAGDVRYSFQSNNVNRTSTGGNNGAFGFQVGAGLEAMVSDNISVGVEYAYTNLGDSNFNTRFTNAPFVVVNPAGSDLRGSDRTFDFHQIKGTLKFHF